VLLLDIESGSVASALIRLSLGHEPRVLAYQRQDLPMQATRHSGDMTRSLERALAHSLAHTSEVAARMRQHTGIGFTGSIVGNIERAAVFLAAPWGTPNLASGNPEYAPGMREHIQRQIQGLFGDIPVSFFTSADSIAYSAMAVGKDEAFLVAAVRGELCELVLLEKSGPQGYSTVPLGSGSVWRTLMSHGLLSKEEARSRLRLAHANNVPYEPLLAAARHVNEQVALGIELLTRAGTPQHIMVVGEHPLGEWFAQNLADDPHVADLFGENGTVEALRPHHLGRRVEAGAVDDPFILLEALFIGAQTAGR